MSNAALCPYQENCSGCDYLHIPYQQQKELKMAELKAAFDVLGARIPPIDFIQSHTHFALRDRLDFTYTEGKIGLYSKRNTSDKNRSLLDIAACAQLHPDLQKIYTEFRSILLSESLPMKKASFRLRRGFEGIKGLWIDAANIDIKKLLDEGVFLKKLLTAGFFIEIGQKGKSLSLLNQTLKLTDPNPQKWFSTNYLNQEVGIYSLISSFTQPSMTTNKSTATLIADWSSLPNVQTVIEFGAGIGNLSLAAKKEHHRWIACEYDGPALDCFKKTCMELKIENDFQFLKGDFQNKEKTFENIDLAIVNPPRSGLKDFSHSLNLMKPDRIIYMSCFLETMIADLQLLKHNFSVKKLSILDQFPQSKHYEIFCLLELH